VSMYKDQVRFMQACGQTIEGFNPDQAGLYAKLIQEEFKELMLADTKEDVLKELMDCMVVFIGYGISMGWNLDRAWNTVWTSNMSKIDPVTGKVEKREDGKVLKPASYKAPDLSKIVGD